jgi:hypothetical protein
VQSCDHGYELSVLKKECMTEAVITQIEQKTIKRQFTSISNATRLRVFLIQKHVN